MIFGYALRLQLSVALTLYEGLTDLTEGHSVVLNTDLTEGIDISRTDQNTGIDM
jgi:hypothetical protein